MPNPTTDTPTSAATAPARTHARGRRAAAPAVRARRDRLSRHDQGHLNGVPYGGAQVAAFLGAQSVVQRLNHVVPGRWQQQFTPVPAELTPIADNGRGRAGCISPAG